LQRALIPEGKFGMGSTGRRDDEEPEHSVFVSAFEMALTAVTNRDYRLYLEATAAAPPLWWHDRTFNRPRQPVVGLNGFEAQDYLRWLSAETGLALRLPTEAEREKAARGGETGLPFPWGDDPAGGGHARLKGPLEGPEEVATTAPNGYGLFNMADSVHEWCRDGYRPDYYRDSPSVNPCAPASTPRRSARGGSWRHRCVVTPCSARSSLPPELHYSDFGLRWVRAL
ncbi:MAG: formylglycine-generating enzyme family protein, partial [Acidobacteriota bacterium]